jgi:putative heme-binding domain-containing protein
VLLATPSALLVAEDAPPLPVQEDLVVHFDAAVLEAPKRTEPEGAPAAPPERNLAAWPDRSGRGFHALQPNVDAQPKLVPVGGSAVVRFDGIDDCLRVVGMDQSLEAATIFIVAAARENPGGFRAFLAANARGRRDFETGFTVDMGPFATPAFSQLNVEGAGFVGAQSLARSAEPFGTLQVIEIVVSPSGQKVSLTIDGAPAGSRDFRPGELRMDELTLGARYYNLFAPEQHVTGWIAADIAEAAIYSRELAPPELARVRNHLLEKHADLKREIKESHIDDGRLPLEMVQNPPPLQVFVPGFEVRELPLDLPNINNIRYRPDGKLVALAYNGDVYLISDSSGDGLGDQAELFWKNESRVRAPIGMALTPPEYALGQGLFIATKSECLLLADTDGDDRADLEQIVANGWQESFHNVDALGVAVDPDDHSVYFGLGTANFADPLVKNESGQPTYELAGERGTILKVAPDFSRREVFCTGIRFPVALAFNRAGDLFATDQEGATWVPNGNPLDELLHIQRGRHYGFPPRHPEFLPDVVDEPSVYDYSPQHQSTCGLTFNEPVGEGPSFGPPAWEGDAFVCGYSRGKLYQTKLVKTPAGYVAANRLLAGLDMLTVDSCVTPQGDLLVAVHSGGPDWGSGPSGKGKLYSIKWADREAPQPVAAWPAGPGEVRIAFDRALDPETLHGLLAECRITYGEHVRAGDEFESIRPGYEVVARQSAAPRWPLGVHSTQISADRRTLTLLTDVRPDALHYAIHLPGLGRPPLSQEPASDGQPLPQHPRIDLDYSMHGVQATWTAADSTWTGWLPHVDPAVNRAFTQGSAEHEELFARWAAAGTLSLQTRLDLSNMLRAAVQPGSKLDYEPSPETVTLRCESTTPFTLAIADADVEAQQKGERFVALFTTQPAPGEWLPLEVVLDADRGSPNFTLAWHTAEDERLRPMPLHRFLLPWATKPDSLQRPTLAESHPELEGGSWARGRKLFFSDAVQCSKCHRVAGAGESIGPDLSNLIHRDYASVLRDVSNPSYALNPDYITHNVILEDGRVLSGTLRSEGEQLLISDAQAKVTKVGRDDVESTVASAKSIMPDDLTKKLAPEQLRDLMTFLLLAPPHMPLESPQSPPPPRSRAELQAVLAGAPEPPEPTRPIRVVLVAGPKDHGPGEHDYPAWQTAWSELLRAGSDTAVDTAWEWPSDEQLAAADVLVFYQRGTWTPERAKDIDAFLERGGGLVYIHYAVDGGQDAPGFAQRIGLAWRGGQSKFRHGSLELGFETGSDHPIGRNLDSIDLVDESYWNLVGDTQRIDLVASGVEDGQPQPLFWTFEPTRQGRVFVSIPGHFSWSFDDPLFRLLLLRGIAWAAHEPVDRFNDLAEIGARIKN